MLVAVVVDVMVAWGVGISNQEQALYNCDKAKPVAHDGKFRFSIDPAFIISAAAFRRAMGGSPGKTITIVLTRLRINDVKRKNQTLTKPSQ